jgi:hypothetical protein
MVVPGNMTVSELNATMFPTTAVVPSEFTLNASRPLVLVNVLVLQEGLALMIAYAYVPFGSTTSDEGKPFRTQTRVEVSPGELLIVETLPLPRLKLNVSISPEP